MSLSTLADQVGACAAALRPLHSLIENHVLQADAYAGYNRLYVPDWKPEPAAGAFGLGRVASHTAANSQISDRFR